MQAVLVGTRVFVSDFVDGVRVFELKRRETEVDALAHALWLERHGLHEQAEKYLDDYIRRNSVTRH